jgi:hypothetical protein
MKKDGLYQGMNKGVVVIQETTSGKGIRKKN